jgi:hypothetical protein
MDRVGSDFKDQKLFPQYDAALQAAMREESDRMVSSVLWQGDGTLGTFLSSSRSEVNAPLARLYGVPTPAQGWSPVQLDKLQRAGFLTRANFLSSHAHDMTGSPVLRGLLVRRRLLCDDLPLPPSDIEFTPTPLDGQQTNRQRYEGLLAHQTCLACHRYFTVIGFGFENYDAIGQYRTTDNGQPVDARGEIIEADVAGAFDGAIALSQILAGSAQVQRCAVTTWFEYGVGRRKDSADACLLGRLDDAVTRAQGDLREALVEMVASDEFIHRPPVTP